MITIPEKYILYINIGLLLYYLVMIIRGYRYGVFKQLIELVGTLAALFVAWRYCTVFSRYILLAPKDFLPLQDTLLAPVVERYANILVWFLLLFFAVRLILVWLEKILGRFQRIPGLRQISAVAGAALSAINATIGVFIMIVLLNTAIFKNGAYVVSHTAFGTIQSLVSEQLEKHGLPTGFPALVDRFYKASHDLSAEDQKAVENWLLEQGFKEKSTK